MLTKVKPKKKAYVIAPLQILLQECKTILSVEATKKLDRLTDFTGY